jgi:hypothetical protein
MLPVHSMKMCENGRVNFVARVHDTETIRQQATPSRESTRGSSHTSLEKISVAHSQWTGNSIAAPGSRHRH